MVFTSKKKAVTAKQIFMFLTVKTLQILLVGSLPKTLVLSLIKKWPGQPVLFFTRKKMEKSSISPAIGKVD
jgi:hypothetical protein